MAKNRLILERLEERILLAADPVAAIEVADTGFIEEAINFTVSFENDAANNSATDVGYQPHLDVVVEKGIKVSGASYLGSSVTLNEVAYWDTTDSRWEDAVDGSGAVVTGHPQDSTGDGAFNQPGAGTKTGDVWYSVQLPFGSFTYDQPKVEIDFAATLDAAEGAEVGTALDIKAIANFAFGDADALNNPATDAPVQGAEFTASITPTVWTIDKTIIAPETETATGPSFPRTWQIEIDIANGQTVTDIDITDVLPNNLVYVDGSIAINTTGAAAASGQTISQIPTAGQVNNAPNNDFLIEFGSVEGTTAKDIVITYQAYVNNLDANGGNVINPLTGDDTISVNNASADGSYLANVLAQITDTDTLQDKSIAIQKSVAIVGGGATVPGAFAEYTLEFQISDYFSFDDLIIDDNFSDGLRFDSSFTPTFTVTENGTTVATTNFNLGNFTVALNADNNPTTPATDGSTDVQFRLSNQLNGTTIGQELSGDQFNGNAAGDGGTVGTIKFRVEIQEDFTDTFVSGDNSVDMGDVLTNTVTITGDVKNTDGTDTGFSESDNSSADLTIDQIQATKSIYAIDGDTNYIANNNTALTPGETVTYRIKLDLSSADAENLIITDFLPLPILTATTVTANTFAAAPSGTVPVAGSASFGPDHTLHNATLVRDNGGTFNGIPTIITNATNNTVQFDFGTFDDNGAANGPQVIDILFTVAANDEPFGNGLFLTNQALVGIGSTNGSTDAITEIVQIEVEEPELILKKGIVSTNAGSSTFTPGTVAPTGVVFDAPDDSSSPFSGIISSTGLLANPIDSNMTGADKSDLVKFAVVVENIGKQSAFDLLLNDQLPDGFELPTSTEGLNFNIYNGAGTQLTFVDEAGNSLINDAEIIAKFFSTTPGEGIRIADTVNGSIAAGKTADGTVINTGENIIIITYDLQAKIDIDPATVHTGTAELLEYAVQENGTDFTTGNSGAWEDAATVTAISSGLTKTLTGTEINDATNENNEAVIGEWVRYTLVLTVPEITTNAAKIVDTLDTGLSFFDVESVTSSSSDVAFTGSPLTPTVGGSNGDILTFDFGNISNSNTDNATTETITIVYRALATNVATNQSTVNESGPDLDNSAVFSWNNGSGVQSLASVSADEISIIEPELTLSQIVRVDSDGNGFDAGDGSTGDVGDDVEYTITLEHSATSEADAYDLVLNNTLPSGLDSLTITSVAGTGSAVLGDFAIIGGNLQVAAGQNVDLVRGQTIIIKVTGTINNTVSPQETIANTVNVQWSSFDDDITDRSSNLSVINDDERAGALGTTNTGDYNASDTTNLSIASSGLTKTLTGTEINDATNENNEAVIGEWVRYTLVLTVPEITTNAAKIVDTLDTGLSFFDVESVTSSSGDIAFTGSPLTPTVGGSNGDILTFDFGNISNSNTDNATTETITIVYRALATNVATNQSTVNESGPDLDNSAVFSWNNGSGVQSLASVSADEISIIEPELTLSQIVRVDSDGNGFDAGDGSTGDVGDDVEYTITLEHSPTSEADAYDLVLNNTLPSGLDSLTITSVAGTGSAVLGDFAIVGGNLQVAAGQNVDLVRGQTIIIKVTGTINNTVSPQETIANTVNVQWSSLDGDITDHSTDASVTNDDERAGALGTTNTGDYNASDTTNLSIASSGLTKTLTGTEFNDATNGNDEAVIGEWVRYTLVLTVPEVTTNAAQIVDTLDTGLSFLDVESVTSSSGDVEFTGSPLSPTIASGGESITFDFGTISNSNTDNTTAETITIVYRALVTNVGSNQSTANEGGPNLDNSAVFSFTNGSGAQSLASVNADTVSIIEPILEISKTLETSNTGVDAGDTVQYKIEITHAATSEADAFDLNITDQLPTELENISIVSGVIDATDITSLLTINSSEQLVFTANAIDLLKDQTLTIVVGGIVQDDVNPDDILSNAATVTWSSVSGSSVNERDGSGGNNDYTASDSAVDVPIVDPFEVTKTASATTAVIGENITYTLEVSVVEGTTTNLNIIDTLPAGMIYGGDAVVSNANGMTINNFAASATGQTLTLTANSILNPADNDAAAAEDSDSFFITYSVRVDNVISNQQGTTLINDADASADNVTPDNDNQTTVTVNEPVLSVTTSTSGVPAIPSIGNTFQFTTSVDHDGVSTVTANDLLLTDSMPPELKIISIDSIAGTNSLGLTPDDFTITGGGSGWTLNPGFDLDLADDFTLTYTVEILDIIGLNQNLSNDVDLSWDSLDGADSNARDGSDGPAGALNDYAETANAATITTNNISISKIISDTDQAHTNGNDVVIGETITYELTINFSETTTNNVVVNDILPQQLSYIAGSLTMTTGNTGMTTQFIDENTSANYDPTTRILTVNLDNINNPDNSNTTDDKITLHYQAVVENDISNQSPDVKANNVTVSSDGGLATDTTDAVILEPELEISLAVSNKTPIINETIQYTLTVDHTSASETDAFDLILTNLLTDPDLTITGIDSIAGTNSAGLSVNDFVITPDSSGIVFAAPGTLDLGLTDDFTLVFSVKVSSDPASIGNINDTSANISWSSIDGDNSNERDGTGGVNDYHTTTNQDVTLSPVPPKPALPIFVFDASHNDADQDDEGDFFYRKDRLVTLPPLPIFPIFSGATEPGTTLNFKLYNEAGAEIGSQTVMADTGGNWLANFPGNIIFDQPHSMRVEQTASVASFDGASGFNLRTYFSPAMNEQLFFSHAYTPETVFSNTASASLQAIHQGLNNPFNLGGGDFYAYEYLSSSSTTTQGH